MNIDDALSYLADGVEYTNVPMARSTATPAGTPPPRR